MFSFIRVGVVEYYASENVTPAIRITRDKNSFGSDTNIAHLDIYCTLFSEHPLWRKLTLLMAGKELFGQVTISF